MKRIRKVGWKYPNPHVSREKKVALIKDATFARSTETGNETNSTHRGRRKVATKLAVPNCTSLADGSCRLVGWLVGWFGLVWFGWLVRWTRRQSPARFLVITVPGIPAQPRRRDVSGPRHQCDTGDKSGTIVERDGGG